MTPFESAIADASAGRDLAADEVERLIDAMLRGEADDADVGRVLLALREKGESASELVGAARAMRRHMSEIACDTDPLVDTCGTGGDGSGTFNISTAAALVTAAAGIPVAKHGNRRITSRTGSADVLAELGVEVDAPREVVQRCLAEAGVCFCFAPRLHPAMRHVAAIRRQLGVPTLFNLLGPLCNPAGATHQLLGTGRRAVQQKLAAALRELGAQRALVVRGEDGLDEVTLDGPTAVIEVTPAGMTEAVWKPSDFGLFPAGLRPMHAEDPAESAAIIRRVLEGEPGPCRDIVLANAAAAIWLAGRGDSLAAATALAARAIDSGRAVAVLARLAELTRTPEGDR